MASKNSSATVKVSGSAANYTPATLDPELRSSINSVLIEEGHVGKYVYTLSHILSKMSPVDPVTLFRHKQDPRSSLALAACPLVQLAYDCPEPRPRPPPFRRNQFLPRPSTTSLGRCATRYSQCSLGGQWRCKRKEASQRRRHYKRQRANSDNDSTQPSGSAGRYQ